MKRAFSSRAPPAPRPWFLSWPGLAIAAALALAWRGSGGSLSTLFSDEARSSALDFARAVFRHACRVCDWDPALAASAEGTPPPIV